MNTQPSSFGAASNDNTPIWSEDWISNVWEQMRTGEFAGLGESGLWDGLSHLEALLNNGEEDAESRLAELIAGELSQLSTQSSSGAQPPSSGVDPLTGISAAEGAYALQALRNLYQQGFADLVAEVQAVDLHEIAVPGDQGKTEPLWTESP